MANYYLFRCSNRTYKECMDRNLFGQKTNLKQNVLNIKTGDILFLHNISTDIISGPFFATSEGKENIISEAWGGDFPMQVKIGIKGSLTNFYNSSFEKFGLVNNVYGRMFDFKLPNEIGRKLLSEIGIVVDLVDQKFLDLETIDSADTDYRLKYPANYRTTDGHYVRSRAEVIVDNWLYNNSIAHIYEKKVPGERMYSDFFVKYKGQSFYFEVWGMIDENYKKRKKQKVELYNSKKLSLIEIFPKDLENIDDKLGDVFNK